MFNIFYDPNYSKIEKVFFTTQLKYSRFLDFIFYISYKLLIPVPNNFIHSGPLKRFNNLLKGFDKKIYSFNKNKHANSYIVQYDDFGKSKLKEIIRSNNFENKKIIVGPLFNVESQFELVQKIKQYKNIKMIVASDSAYTTLVEEMKIGLSNKEVFVCPSGVIKENNLISKNKFKPRENKALIYKKNRSDDELHKVIELLESKNIEYEIFSYGNYKNSHLHKAAKRFKFGIILDRTESQGFAIQEIMSCNLPLIIWKNEELSNDAISDYYGVEGLTGTPVPYWSNLCGVIYLSFEDMSVDFDNFIKNIHKYEPQKYIKETLTFEVVEQKINSIFKSIIL